MTDPSDTTWTTSSAPGDGPRLTFFTWYSVLGTALLVLVLGGTLVTIWALTSSPSIPFWPSWVLVILGALLLVHALTTASVHGLRHRPGMQIRVDRVPGLQIGIECHAASSFSLAAMLWGFCMITRDAGATSVPWPVWPSLVLGFAVGVHGMVALVVSRGSAYRAQLARVTTTRAGVVEAQELELRRIERDLHDGAQARLVALGMQLGRAQQQLDSSPDAARELLAEARVSTRLALQELRALARGIYPPVLADRGLVPAIQSLVAASPLDVRVVASPDEHGGRLPAALEGALYFTAAEALANAGKHARCTTVDITVRRGAFDVALTVVDDGIGGASATGSGLVGIRQRIEALDGTLTVTSPAGGPTTIRAEVPCEPS